MGAERAASSATAPRRSACRRAMRCGSPENSLSIWIRPARLSLMNGSSATPSSRQ